MNESTLFPIKEFNDVKNSLELLKMSTDMMFLLVMGCLIFCEYIYN